MGIEDYLALLTVATVHVMGVVKPIIRRVFRAELSTALEPLYARLLKIEEACGCPSDSCSSLAPVLKIEGDR